MARKPTDRELMLERENALLRRQLDAIRADPGDIPFAGCGDSGCICCAGPGGMHTNGGCRCEPRSLRRAVQWWRRVAAFRLETIRMMRNQEPTDE